MSDRTVTWRSPVQLHHPRREFDLPPALVEVLEEILATPRPADGGNFATWRQAITRASTLVRLYEDRAARLSARDALLAADDGLMPASDERRGELAEVDRHLRARLKLEVVRAVLNEDRGLCTAEAVAAAAGIPVDEVQQLVTRERR